MDEPFPKRPRLSMFADHSSNAGLDHDLDTMRYRNDFLLKSRFESIFEKYSRDFDGVGDEIDLVSGKILVDNGHLQSMTAETDTGVDEEDERGKALLRAMTEAQDREDPYFNEGADDVLLSIEEIAENAVVTMAVDLDTPEDSEDELLPPLPSHTPLATPPDSRGNDATTKSDAVSLQSESDTDSLFDVPIPRRSSSPDSLFQAESAPDNANDLGYRAEDSSLIGSALPIEKEEECVILAKYGPHVGNEVIDLLRRERENAEAHIEPAWRIPSNIIPPKASTSPATFQTPPPLPPVQRSRPHSLEDQKPLALHRSSPLSSIWKAPRALKVQKTSGRRRLLRKLRADSEDPLQDGFVSDHADGDNGEASGSEYEEETERKQKKRGISQVSLEDEDEQIKALRQGFCIYCGQQYKTRAGVVSHWAKLVGRFETKEEVDDVHDIAYILEYRQQTGQGAQRPPRLTVSDFRTMVELHEGAGLSFAEIADCRALRTRKTGPGLVEVYDRYRIAPEDEKEAEEWSPEELSTLDKLCENPIRDMSTFSKQLHGRTDADIAGRLAEIWLRELQKAIRPPKDRIVRPTSQTQWAGSTSVGSGVQGQSFRRDSTEDPLFIKEEYED